MIVVCLGQASASLIGYVRSNIRSDWVSVFIYLMITNISAMDLFDAASFWKRCDTYVLGSSPRSGMDFVNAEGHLFKKLLFQTLFGLTNKKLTCQESGTSSFHVDVR